MRILVTYDVSTSTAGGERRLRRVAQVCINFGQRVQKSVFECVVTEPQYEILRRNLVAEIDATVDNLRLYRLPEDIGALREVIGVVPDIDFKGPLVV